MPTSVGGRAKINHPPPESTESKPSTSLKKVRSVSGSRLKIIAWAPEMSALMGSVYCEARPAFAMPCKQTSRATAHEKTVDFDGIPSLRELDRPREPIGWLGGAQREPGEPVEAAHQEAPQVGHESPDSRAVRKTPSGAFARVGKSHPNLIRITPLEP